jgi:hypothetical protein
MKMSKLVYLRSFWNIIDLISLIINLAYIAVVLTKMRFIEARPLGACCVFIMWLKMFYFLRLFNTTASIIRLIIQVFKDMTTFAIVLFIAIIGFGNTFYIYSNNFESTVAE